jgi:NACHT domain
MQKNQADAATRSAETMGETQEIARKLAQYITRSEGWQAAMLDTTHGNHLPNCPPTSTASNRDSSLIENLSDYSRDWFSNQILEMLRYAEIDTRQDDIPKAHQETFQWIFKNPEQDQSYDDFAAWLTGNDETAYWITGKPGSGKSTLMKFIFENQETTVRLGQWAADKPLLKCSFFFWCAGTGIQMSQEGLFRKILHDLYSQSPALRSLIPQSYPHRLEAFLLLGDSIARREKWGLADLRHSVRRLINIARKTNCIALFIDGLDEFSGNHIALLDLLHDLSGPNVKLCVASRPWPIFEDAFGQRPKLKMEYLTSSDILNYVTSKFNANAGFQILRDQNKKHAEGLIQVIAEKALGVFLWVYLAVQSLLEGLSEGDRLSDLKLRVDNLPSELTDLFQNILKSLGPKRYTKACKLFQLHRASNATLTLSKLSFAEEEDAEFAFNLSLGPLTAEQMETRFELTRRRLVSYSRCLLEVGPSGRTAPLSPVSKVRFLHRTAKDFFDQSNIWKDFEAVTDKEGFNSNFQVWAACVAELKKIFPTTISQAAEYAVRADPEYTGMQKRLLDEIVRALLQRMELTVTAEDTESVIENSVIGPGRGQVFQCTHGPCRSQFHFLAFAANFQLSAYFKEYIQGLPESCQGRHLTQLLRVAVFADGPRVKKLEFVQILFKRGVKLPNEALSCDDLERVRHDVEMYDFLNNQIVEVDSTTDDDEWYDCLANRVADDDGTMESGTKDGSAEIHQRLFEFLGIFTSQSMLAVANWRWLR